MTFCKKKLFSLKANYKDDLEMYNHEHLFAIEPCKLSNNIGFSDFRGKKSDEILEITRSVQATKDLWGLKYIWK